MINEEYTRKAVDFHNKTVAGYIGNGSNPTQLSFLKSIVGDRALILAPGIKINASTDSFDQQYGTPRDAINAGADILILGRAILESENPKQTAAKYREIAWEEFKKKLT